MLPKEITKEIRELRTQDLHQLLMKDIYWVLSENPNNRTRHKEVQLESLFMKVGYGANQKSIDASFPGGATVRFDSKYFERYPDMKFASLIYLILDEFGPIQNPMVFHLQQVRNRGGLYKNFKSRSVLRNSLKTDPVFQTLLFMTTVIPVV
jgi:hypothetical protein